MKSNSFRFFNFSLVAALAIVVAVIVGSSLVYPASAALDERLVMNQTNILSISDELFRIQNNDTITNNSALENSLNITEDAREDEEEAVDTEEDENESEIENETNVTSSIKPTRNQIVINEVESNPRGNDVGREWIELYNPTEDDIDISEYRIKTSFRSVVIVLPVDATIESKGIYLIGLDRQILSNTAEVLTLTDPEGNTTIDKTPSLVDKKDDTNSWQRVSDGNNEWKFSSNSRNDHNSESETMAIERTDNDISVNSTSAYDAGLLDCSDVSCVEGLAVRIVDGDTLYIKNENGTYKVELALVKTPSMTEDGFAESNAFTRGLCLGSDVEVNVDENQTESRSLVGIVHCSSENLNEELLDNGYGEFDILQCEDSEFGQSEWAKDAGCD